MKQSTQEFRDGLPRPEADHVILEVPAGADPDLFADAFVTFAEESFPEAAEPFGWQDVTERQFDEVCLSLRAAPPIGPALHAVFSPTRLAVIAGSARPGPEGWDRLVTDLVIAQEGVVAPDHDWLVLAMSTAAQSRLLEPEGLRPADRSRPVRATPSQAERLALFDRQPDGRHGVVAMRPIFLDVVNEDALAATFEALQERHEVLHMTVTAASGADYLGLDDSLPVPFEVISPLTPWRSLAQVADRETRALASRPMDRRGLWRAALVRHRGRGAVICVLSEAITDQRSAELLRAEILQFEAAFRAGQDPEAAAPALPVQFIDHAAVAPDLSARIAWWDELVPMMTPEAPKLPDLAPVEPFTQVLHLEGDPARLLRALKASLPGADWALVTHPGERPAGHPDMLGPFAFPCPVWLGDVETEAALNATFAQGAMTLTELAAAFPGRVPAPIPLRLDWRDEAPPVPPLAYDSALVTLRATRTPAGLHLDWAIRKDHPAGLRARIVARDFARHLRGLRDG